MTGEECYATWAPEDCVWSRWVRPVLFAQMDSLDADTPQDPAPADAAFQPAVEPRTAVIFDIGGADAVRAGLLLARRGWRPVPLFNGTHGLNPLIDVRPIAQELRAGAATLRALALVPDAPPAFLLDARRMEPTPHPGHWDNRWVVLPQDFPSGTFLRSHGIERVLLVTPPERNLPADLSHILLRWKDAGIEILVADTGAQGSPRPLDVKPPAWYRQAAWAVVAFMGLRRSNVGGFGGTIPMPTSGSGFS